MKIVITGGHHTSALPVIKILQTDYSDVEIVWFGHKYSAAGDKNPTLEYREITALGIPFYHIHAGKFYKTYNLVRLAKIPFSLAQCFFLLIKIKPRLILSFGGYVSVPVVIAGYLLRIRSVIHEQTVVAGWANRVAAKFAGKILVSWERSKKYFPAHKTTLVGLPLRQAIYEVRTNNFVVDNNLPYVYVTTGKIGSHIMNSVVGECLADLLAFTNVVHQCGDNSVFNDFDYLTHIYARIGDSTGKFFLRKFVFADEIGEAFTKASIVVSRSGAHTTAELVALAKPCILIPIPWTSHNEQYENALVLQDAGLGKILPEQGLTPKKLVEAIKQFLDLVKTGPPVQAVSSKAAPDPARLIVKELLLA